MKRQRRSGRPTLTEAAALKESILECALDMLCSRGIGGLHMDALAEAAGVTKRTIYRYFAHKVALAEAVLDREMARVTRGIPAVPCPSGGSLMVLRAWGEHFFATVMTPRIRRFGVLLSFESLSDPDIAAMLRHWAANASAPIEAMIGNAQAAGELRAGDRRMFTLLFLDLITGPGGRMDFHYPEDQITGGLSQDRFYATRWGAFLQLAGPDPWATGLQRPDIVAGQDVEKPLAGIEMELVARRLANGSH